MHTAPVGATAQLPHHVLAGISGLTQRLADIGISVQYATDVPAEDVGELDEESGVLWVRADAPAAHRAWLLLQCWSFLTVGPHASPAAQVTPHLQLVLPLPLQRTADETAS
jgi:hypothetical protein